MADKTSGKLKVRAEDNPWYLLATLYGQPTARDDELAKRNRVAWNRYMASAIRDELKSDLIKAGRHLTEELTPFSEKELQAVQTAFAERCGRDAKIGDVPGTIDFSDVEFDKHFFATGLVFPKPSRAAARSSPAMPASPARSSPALPPSKGQPSPALPALTGRPSPVLPPSIRRPSPALPSSMGRPSPALPPSKGRSSPAVPSSTAQPSPALRTSNGLNSRVRVPLLMPR